MSKTNKDFLLDILRSAFITKEDANIIFDEIRNAVISELIEGNEVNLFDLVCLKPKEKQSHTHNTLTGSVVLPDRVVLSTRVYPRLKREWIYIND